MLQPPDITMSIVNAFLYDQVSYLFMFFFYLNFSGLGEGVNNIFISISGKKSSWNSKILKNVYRTNKQEPSSSFC